MINFESFIKRVENTNQGKKETVALLKSFCMEALISEKDMTIFEGYVEGKKQRELSLLFNIHQPLISRAIKICKSMMRATHSFLFNDFTYEAVLLSKNLLTENEYTILNYRLVGYGFKEIAQQIKATPQYAWRTCKEATETLQKYKNNDGISNILSYLKTVNSFWAK